MAVITTDGDAEKVELANTLFETLAQWCEYTKDERGWDIGPHAGGSIVDDLARGVDA